MVGIMSFSLCLLNHVRIILDTGASREVFKCDSDGLESGETLKSEPSQRICRYYVCSNCGVVADGSDSFDEMRKHLGKHHDLIDPFSIKEAAPSSRQSLQGGRQMNYNIKI